MKVPAPVRQMYLGGVGRHKPNYVSLKLGAVLFKFRAGWGPCYSNSEPTGTTFPKARFLKNSNTEPTGTRFPRARFFKNRMSLQWGNQCVDGPPMRFMCADASGFRLVSPSGLPGLNFRGYSDNTFPKPGCSTSSSRVSDVINFEKHSHLMLLHVGGCPMGVEPMGV